MWRHRHGERHPVGGCRFNSFAQPGANGTVGDLPDAHLFRSAGALIPAFQRYFQGGHHHFQLAGILRIGKRNVTMRLAAGRSTAGRSGRFLHPLFEGCQLHERVGRGQGKITPGQGQCFVNTGAGVPQGGQQHLTVKIGHVVEQGAHFRRQQVFRQFVLNERHLAQCQRGRVIDGHRQLSRGKSPAMAWQCWHHVMSPLSLECAVHHRCIRGCRTRQDQILGSRFDTVIGVIFKRNRACFHPREKSFFKTAGTRKR